MAPLRTPIRFAVLRKGASTNIESTNPTKLGTHSNREVADASITAGARIVFVIIIRDEQLFDYPQGILCFMVNGSTSRIFPNHRNWFNILIIRKCIRNPNKEAIVIDLQRIGHIGEYDTIVLSFYRLARRDRGNRKDSFEA
jgi:hypothetical protein